MLHTSTKAPWRRVSQPVSCSCSVCLGDLSQDDIRRRTIVGFVSQNNNDNKKSYFVPWWRSAELGLTANFAALRSPLPSRRCTAAMASSFRRSCRPRCPAAGLSAAIPCPNRSSRPRSASSLCACAAFLAVETEAEHNHEYIY